MDHLLRTPSSEGDLGKVERASASRSRASNPLLFFWTPHRARALDTFGPRELLSRGSENLAVPDVEDAIGDVRNPSVVGDNDDGLLEILVQSLEQIEDFLASLRIEFSCGLVREEQGRIVRQGDRNGDPLLLAAAQLVRPMARTVGEADEIKEFLGPSLPGRAVFGGEAHRQLDGLLGRPRRA